MKDYSISGIALVIIGVLLIVFGAGTALAGVNKMDAAEEWEEAQTETDCASVHSDIDVENDSAEEIQENIRNSTPECVTTTPENNPYSGGQTDVGVGAVLAVIGGTSTYFGNKR